MRFTLAMTLSITLLFTVLFSTLYFLGHSEKKAQYFDTAAWMNHDTNTCFSSGNVFDINVQVVYKSMDGVVGQWSAGQNIIALNPSGGMDIDTVSHEVSHMVDTMMNRYNVKDNHFEAWFQGQWTACVWSIVEKDLIEAGQLQVFKFSS